MIQRKAEKDNNEQIGLTKNSKMIDLKQIDQ